MIDIHCHILPELDDGARDLSDSLAMARAAAAEGINGIIATPHYNTKYVNPRRKVLESVDALNTALGNAGISLEIFPGQEPRISGEFLENYERAELLSLNDGRMYIFVEFPSGHLPRYASRLLYDIQVAGLTPVIVHPERNHELLERPEKLYELVNNGALTQVTATSVTGHFGKKLKKYAEKMIASHLVHFIASDAHNTTSRPFKLREAYEEIEQQFGVDFRYLFMENAEAVVQNRPILKEMPQPVKRKKFFGLF